MRSNNNVFLKFMGPEDNLHHAVCNYIAYQYPRLYFFHPMNEGKRSKFEQFKAKYLFMRSGVPDIIIPEWQVVIELKIKPNKPTPNQREALTSFKDIGWSTYVCYSFDEAKEAIEQAHSKYVKQKQVA